MTVSTPAQARLLLDAAYQHLLAGVMHGPKSAVELANEAGIPLKRAHHQLKRLCQARLIMIDSERPRAGRPVKLYRAAAECYRVPIHLTETEDFAALLRALHEPYLKRIFMGIAHHVLAQDSADELTLSLNEFGQLAVTNTRRAGQPARAAGQASMSEIRLLPETYVELKQKLEALEVWMSERASIEQRDTRARRGVYGLMFTQETSS